MGGLSRSPLKNAVNSPLKYPIHPIYVWDATGENF
jgi:hypothetical protein